MDLFPIRSKRMLLTMQNGPLDKLFDILEVLRGEDGCPWDRAQRPEGILSDLIEEVYELQWAYAQGDGDDVLDETGDVLFVLVFAIILLNGEYPRLTLENVTAHAHDKIKRRHPHVFGDAVARTQKEGLGHWERIKALEKKGRRDGDSSNPFADIPDNLPAIRRAEKIQERAARSGFDWHDSAGVLAKIREEVTETEEALADSRGKSTEEEVGDLLFSVLNLVRFLGMDGEQTLTAANAKFVRRYRAMESLARDDGMEFSKLELDDMERYWRQAKKSD